MQDEQDEQDESDGGFQLALAGSYIAFGWRAVRKRWAISLAVGVAGVLFTIGAAVYWPRSFSCTTVLMAMGSAVLDDRDGANALAGASDLIVRHSNLESMIRESGLIQKAAERRPPLLRLKDRIVAEMFGEMSEKTKLASLVGTLEARIAVSTEKGDLSIKVDWSDPRTAAELAEAARESFLKARHSAEISAFEEKMTILDGHAARLRDELGGLAQQLKGARDAQLAHAREEQSQARKASAEDTPTTRAIRPVVTRPAEPDGEVPALKEKLGALKAKLVGLQADRDNRVREEQSKLEEMKLRLTPSHPEVVREAERVAILSQVPSEEALMQAEVKDLEADIQQRDSMARLGGATTQGNVSASTTPGRAPTLDPLPPDIIDLLQRDNQDPALTVQLSAAVTRYGMLRDEILSTRIELDTAQAAFNHRYQVIVPAEVPTKADKPKLPVILGGGLGLSLLLALLLPIALELRRGIIVERWQVEHIQLPVLAELHLPPHSPD